MRSATEPSAQDKTLRTLAELVGPDPLPYGIAQNRPALEFAIQSAFEQGIIATKPSVEEIFLPDTLDLS